MGLIRKLRGLVSCAVIFNVAVLIAYIRYHRIGNSNVNKSKYRREDHIEMNPNKTEIYKRILEQTDKTSLDIINCTNLHEVRLISQLGTGWNKQAFKGDFHGIPVCVKMVNKTGERIENCITETIQNISMSNLNIDKLRYLCRKLPSLELMQEILMYEQLKHPSLARMLGYCVNNYHDVPSAVSHDLSEQRIVSVIELGQEIKTDTGIIVPKAWQRRIKVAIELTDFLIYIEHSPLGSLRITDFKIDHFMIINGNYKYIDLDNLLYLQKRCSRHHKTCEYGVECVDNWCKEYNEKTNLFSMQKHMFIHLLDPSMFPAAIGNELATLLNFMRENKITGALLKQKLQGILE